MARREVIGHNYSGFSTQKPKKKGSGKLKILLILILAAIIYLVYFWVTNPSYAPGLVRDILPNAPERLYQYTDSDGNIQSSPTPPPGVRDYQVISRWDNENLIPQK